MLEPENDNLNLHHLAWKGESKAQTGPYESEVAEIRRRRGTLEDIRNHLGLSKRAMAELLFVDASAWTRWTKGISKVPASVYRSLDWYLRLIEKDPQLQERIKVTQMQKSFQAQKEQLISEMEDLKSQLHSQAWREERAKLLSQLESAEKLGFAWKALLLATFVLALL